MYFSPIKFHIHESIVLKNMKQSHLNSSQRPKADSFFVYSIRSSETAARPNTENCQIDQHPNTILGVEQHYIQILLGIGTIIK